MSKCCPPPLAAPTTRVSPRIPADMSRPPECCSRSSQGLLNVVAAGAALYDQIWLGSYMSAVSDSHSMPLPPTQRYPDDFCYYGVDFAADNSRIRQGTRHRCSQRVPLRSTLMVWNSTRLPTILEDHFVDPEASVLAAASASRSIATAQPDRLALVLSMLLHKEAGTPGFFATTADQCGPTTYSLQSDEATR